jgi:hypothetical protein
MPLPMITTSAVSFMVVDLQEHWVKSVGEHKPNPRYDSSWTQLYRDRSVQVPMPAKPDFETGFFRLRLILEPYAPKMIVIHDISENTILISAPVGYRR